LAGIKESFARRAGESIELLALSQNPGETTRLHGIRAAYRMRLKTLRPALEECDLLLSGGGSLLQDSTSVQSLLYYLWVAHLALQRGKPLMFYAQGLGPLQRPISRRLVARIANRASMITVRDTGSAQLLQDIGVNKPHVEVTADPAFALSPSTKDALSALRRAENLSSNTPQIGVALRSWGDGQGALVGFYAELLNALQKRVPAQIVLLPMHTPDDVHFAEAVLEKTGAQNEISLVRNAYPPSVLLGLVSEMQSVVAMRLHTLIFALRCGVPPFALSYDPKVRSLMEGAGLSEDCTDWKGFDANAIAERVAQQVETRRERTIALQARVPEWEAKALRNADCALEVLGR
jgi:polysaccharide pyruvyl transferase CsaB